MNMNLETVARVHAALHNSKASTFRDAVPDADSGSMARSGDRWLLLPYLREADILWVPAFDSNLVFEVWVPKMQERGWVFEPVFDVSGGNAQNLNDCTAWHWKAPCDEITELGSPAPREAVAGVIAKALNIEVAC